MIKPRTRMLAISGATLALVVASTAVVSAHPGNQGDGEGADKRGFGKDRGGQQFQRGDRGGKSMQGQRGGIRGQIRSGIADHFDQFVRRETIVELDDGVVTKRVDNGTVSATGDASLDYSLATGETASVTTDDETKVVAFETQTVERRGHTRERVVPTEIDLASIESGAEVVVWAQSQDDGSFLAQRIVVQPDVDEATEAADAAAIATEDAALAPVIEA
jgi:hypothetical protein